MSRALDFLSLALASGLFLSHFPVRLFPQGTAGRKWTGAGLVGTLWGLALLPLVPEGTRGFWIFYGAALALAVAVSTRAERVYGNKDDQRIVIDETVGYWAAVAFLPRRFGVLAAGFALFRIFDAAKVPPFRWFERLPRGWGVVFDDVAAGAAANAILIGVVRHGWL